MSMSFLVVPAFFLSAAPAWADVCPAAPDFSKQARELYTQIQLSENERAARVFGGALWDLWKTAPDDHAQALLDRGLAAHSSYDFDRAKAAYDELVAYCPDYAEGYNQRAFVAYLRGQYAEAITDLERAVELNPLHVGAIAGQALTLFKLGRNEAGQTVLRQALALNPWLSERHLLTGPPVEPKIEL